MTLFLMNTYDNSQLLLLPREASSDSQFFADVAELSTVLAWIAPTLAYNYSRRAERATCLRWYYSNCLPHTGTEADSLSTLSAKELVHLIKYVEVTNNSASIRHFFFLIWTTMSLVESGKFVQLVILSSWVQ